MGSVLRYCGPFAIAVMLAACPAAATEPAAVDRILDAGMRQGRVMDYAQHLSDTIGPRITNSPQAREAERWTADELRALGLSVRTEGFEFGPGWSKEHASLRMVSPRSLDLTAVPVAWTPPTAGAVTADIIVAPMAVEADFERWRGKLRGRLVLISDPDQALVAPKTSARRFSDSDLAALSAYEPPQHGGADIGEWFATYLSFNAKLDAFLAGEGAVGWARMAKRSGQVVGEGYFHKAGQTPRLPGVEIAAVDYRRLVRLARSGAVRLEMANLVRFHAGDTKAYNIFGDLPGRDPAAGYVMAGTHLDSWGEGDGAADAGGNVAVVMEAARILTSLGVKPRRTIRFALWGGEQQGLYGIQNYVERYLASRGRTGDEDPARRDYGRWEALYPITPKPGYRDLAAYFCLDNGPGRIRGLYGEGAAQTTPILKEWLAPFAAFGASTVSSQRRIESGHQYLQDIGLPGFQFIQDPIDPDHQIFQTRIDTLDALDPDDLRINAVILATLLLAAAEREEPLPRRPVPNKPRSTVLSAGGVSAPE